MMIAPSNDQLKVWYTTNIEDALALFEKQAPHKTSLIYSDWETLPYLSLADNLYLGVPRKMRKVKNNYEFFQLLGFDPSILRRPLKDISRFQQLRLAILQQLLREPEQLLFVDVTEKLSINETQELLHLVYQVLDKQPIKALFLTQNASFANSLQQVIQSTQPSKKP
ncbi:hypothetical protein [Enterococcus sp. 2201sp1_2201st1_B8_2201SCRN_220225]|uniref:hypothetical protein n=1 Tax=unclassified Enterococcus TaxID=2608891 RepID=UPI0034A151E0